MTNEDQDMQRQERVGISPTLRENKAGQFDYAGDLHLVKSANGVDGVASRPDQLSGLSDAQVMREALTLAQDFEVENQGKSGLAQIVEDFNAIGQGEFPPEHLLILRDRLLLLVDQVDDKLAQAYQVMGESTNLATKTIAELNRRIAQDTAKGKVETIQTLTQQIEQNRQVLIQLADFDPQALKRNIYKLLYFIDDEIASLPKADIFDSVPEKAADKKPAKLAKPFRRFALIAAAVFAAFTAGTFSAKAEANPTNKVPESNTLNLQQDGKTLFDPSPIRMVLDLQTLAKALENLLLPNRVDPTKAPLITDLAAEAAAADKLDASDAFRETDQRVDLQADVLELHSSNISPLYFDQWAKMVNLTNPPTEFEIGTPVDDQGHILLPYDTESAFGQEVQRKINLIQMIRQTRSPSDPTKMGDADLQFITKNDGTKIIATSVVHITQPFTLGNNFDFNDGSFIFDTGPQDTPKIGSYLIIPENLGTDFEPVSSVQYVNQTFLDELDRTLDFKDGSINKPDLGSYVGVLRDGKSGKLIHILLEDHPYWFLTTPAISPTGQAFNLRSTTDASANNRLDTQARYEIVRADNYSDPQIQAMIDIAQGIDPQDVNATHMTNWTRQNNAIISQQGEYTWYFAISDKGRGWFRGDVADVTSPAEITEASPTGTPIAPTEPEAPTPDTNNNGTNDGTITAPTDGTTTAPGDGTGTETGNHPEPTSIPEIINPTDPPVLTPMPSDALVDLHATYRRTALDTRAAEAAFQIKFKSQLETPLTADQVNWLMNNGQRENFDFNQTYPFPFNTPDAPSLPVIVRAADIIQMPGYPDKTLIAAVDYAINGHQYRFFIVKGINSSAPMYNVFRAGTGNSLNELTAPTMNQQQFAQAMVNSVNDQIILGFRHDLPSSSPTSIQSDKDNQARILRLFSLIENGQPLTDDHDGIASFTDILLATS